MAALDDMIPLGRLAGEGHPGRNLQAATSTPVHGPPPPGIVRRERSTSFKFREFGLYVSKAKVPYSSTKPTTVPAPARVPVPVPVSSAQEPVGAEYDPYYYPSSAANPDQEDWLAYSTGYNSSFPQSRFSAATTDASSVFDYGPDTPTPSPPRSPISPVSPPRWDSLSYSSAIIYDPTQHASAPRKPLAFSPTKRSNPAREQRSRSPQLWTSQPRDEYPPPPSRATRVKMSRPGSRAAGGGDGALVENFSRPRRPSIRHPSSDSLRNRAAGNSPPLQSDPTHHDTLGTPNQYLLARERGQSISSNKSASTFASLPVRPTPDLYYRDSVRGRGRQPYPALARQHMGYSRTESSGHSFPRDPLPRMASMPSDELRSSFRSQLSASTAPGTVQTERSSVLTKSSSITSIYLPVDDGLSVDDVMGIYEKGFRDDSPAPADYQDDDSRPATAKSERSRRRTALLDAFSDSFPIQRADAGEEADKSDDVRADVDAEDHTDAALLETDNSAVIRESAAIFANPEATSADLAGGDEDGLLALPPQAPAPERMSFEDTDVTRDRYGFRKQNQYVTQEQYDEWNQDYSEYMERRRRKWQAYMKESGLISNDPIRFPPRSAKTKRFVRKGIPPEWRGAAWFYYAGGPAILAKHGGVYDQLLAQNAKDIDKEAIERDLHRTFPDNVRFRAANTSSAPNTEMHETRSSQSTVTEKNGNAAQPNEIAMISSLRRVLHAFSIYNPRIGYCQSLNFLAGLLLLFTETEEQSFWLLNIITRVYLPGTHETSLEGANVDLGVLMTSVQETMPAVWQKIGGELDGTDAVKPKSRRYRKAGAMPTRLPPVTLCMTSWFMSCFVGTLPIETTLRVWDVFFYEGSKTLFRIALTIFKLGENEIRSVADPMEIFQVVQTIPRRLLNANGLMEACFRRRNGFGHISQDTIEERRMERRKNVKLETERMATGLVDDAADYKRKNTLFGKKRRPAEVA